MILRLKGVKTVRAKGRVYHYHRASGTRLMAEPGTPAFAAEFEAAERRHASGADKTASEPGTWGRLVEDFRKSPEWQRLAPRTRADYQDVLDYLQRMADVALEDIDGRSILRLRDSTFAKKKRCFTNRMTAVISRIWNWGRPRHGLAANPVDLKEAKVERPTDARTVNRPWTDGELETVLAAASPVLRLVIALGAYTGLREGDALRLPWSAYDGRTIDVRQGKTGGELLVKVHRRLKRLLEAAAKAKKGTVIAVNSRGRTYTEDGFRASFFKLLRTLREEGKVGAGLTFHGLRHGLGTRLAEAGASENSIMAVLGHATSKMATHYTQKANRRRLAAEGIALLEGRAGTKRARKMENFAQRPGKPRQSR
jgi:integrase